MEFPERTEAKDKLIDTFCREENLSRQDVRTIASPYRISPLGAHIDHQGGPVLGMTVNACTLMTYVPTHEGKIRLRSQNYPGLVEFELSHVPQVTGSFWGNYARGAALALKEEFGLDRGVLGLLNGMLPGCGLSSSASVTLAYLYALAEVNDIILSEWDYVRLTQRAENKYIGLNNGILDQTSIVFGRRHHLLYIDTIERSVAAEPEKIGATDYRILIAYSGYSRELTTTGYNSRVQECREAAAELSRLEGGASAELLSDISEETFQRYGTRLSPHLFRRANHFFNEARRVQDGLTAWRQGQIEEFGRLMFESCQSSIEQYECGSPAIHDLQQIVGSVKGVIGSRFSGGGFGGCVVGFVQSAHAAVAVADIRDTYRRCHPEVADQAEVYLAGSANGVRFV